MTARVLTDDVLRASLKLPKTTFSMKAQASVREVRMVQRLTVDLYRRQFQERKGEKEFVLHDGPPYANGDVHMGHLLNKTLKDIVNRWSLLQGDRIRYVPGWDCHGLPIELKALEALGAKHGSATAADPLAIRAAAKSFAEAARKRQAAEFKRWGVLGDWDGEEGEAYYITMLPSYEARQLEVFKKMVERGAIYRSRKPVYWSPSSKTALAEAELEYPDGHTSTAAYVTFDLLAASPELTAACQAAGVSPSSVKAMIWTTTPWTLAANVAIAVNPNLDYTLLRVTQDGEEPQVVLVATELLPVLRSVLLDQEAPTAEASDGAASPHSTERITKHKAVEEIGQLPGAALEGSKFKNPIDGRESHLILGTHVTADSGTGLVHTAPGHGLEDYYSCLDYGLPILCPVDDDGVFTEEAGPLQGLPVLGEGNQAALEMLEKAKALVLKHSYEHRYPYDWRTKKPVIFRATYQWFANVEGLLDNARSAIESVAMVPAVSRNRLGSMVGSRKEWCISRQRSWGVPIPVLYEAESGEPLLTPESIDHIIGIVKQHGSNAWWELPAEEFVPPSLKGNGKSYIKGADTLDVWFDSGASWAAAWPDSTDEAPDSHPEYFGPLGRPADVVLEGSDQHRGWFQSSLLTSVAAHGAAVAPYRKIITHGFVMDANRRKMSKSLGNVVAPNDIILGSKVSARLQEADIEGPKDPNNKKQKGKAKKQKVKGPEGFETPYGADVARLWTASSDFTRDSSLSALSVKKTSDNLRKIRNTARFLLGNLNGFNPLTMSGLSPEDAQGTSFLDPCHQAWSLPAGAVFGDAAAWGMDASEGEACFQDSGMRGFDRFMLHRLATFQREINLAYEDHRYRKAVSVLSHFTTVQLSSLYLDLLKDRLYADAASDPARQAAQSILWECLRSLTSTLAPICPFTAEDVYQYSSKLILPEAAASEYWAKATDKGLVSGSPSDQEAFVPSSVFDSQYPRIPAWWLNPEIEARWSHLLGLRSETNKTLEALRRHNDIGSSLEAEVRVIVGTNSPLSHALHGLEHELSEFFGVSTVHLEESSAPVKTGNREVFRSHSDYHTLVLEGFAVPTSLDTWSGGDAFLDDMDATEMGSYSGSASEFRVEVTRAKGAKCQRCWKYCASAEHHPSSICSRCAAVLDQELE